MNNQFIPKELEKILIVLGFDYTQRVHLIFKEKKYYGILWQQAFDWFRDTLLFDSWITPYWFIDGEFKQKRYTFSIEPSNNFDEYFDCKAEDYDTYEEARLECLKNLIEIVKNK